MHWGAIQRTVRLIKSLKESHLSRAMLNMRRNQTWLDADTLQEVLKSGITRTKQTKK